MMRTNPLWNIFVLVVAMAQVVGCYGPVWPSRGMTIKLGSTGPSTMEVKDFIAAELRSQGFVDIGKDGRDILKNQRTYFGFEGPDEIVISIRVDRANEVPIRVSQNRETFTLEANRVFENLAAALEDQWPGSVIREVKPTK